MANLEPTSFREKTVTLDEFVSIAKALSSDLRISIFRKLLTRAMNVLEISEHFKIPASTAALNIKRLEEAGLIRTELLPGTRGTQKLCAAVFTKITLDATDGLVPVEDQYLLIEMPIGHFFDAEVTPTCGLVGANSIIGEYDDPVAFFLPNRTSAELLWFRSGYLEYRFPYKTPHQKEISSIEVSMEICSEAPLYNLNWPSDITLWVNGVELGTWTSPSDFGGERGILTPSWWGLQNTQYGLLKTWRVCDSGSYIDGSKLSMTDISQIPGLHTSSYISVRLGVKDTAKHRGGINLFGKGFGNYETNLLMRIDFRASSED